jgi:hypothetical protein
MRIFNAILVFVSILLSACAATSFRGPASVDSRAYKNLADQVLQNLIFLDSYGITYKHPDLLLVANNIYEARVRSTKDLASSLLEAARLSYNAGVPYLLGRKNKEIGIFGMDLSDMNQRISVSIRSQQSASTNLDAPIVTNSDARFADGIEEEIRVHSEWVTKFFCLKASEGAKFRSGLSDALTAAANTSQPDVDSIDLLVKLKLVDPDVVGSVRRWQASASDIPSRAKLSDRPTIIAELNFLAWSSSVLEAYLLTDESNRLPRLSRSRLETVLQNSNRALAQVALTL